MKYIGNKRNLLDDIEKFTRKHVPCDDLNNGTFLDLFAGSNSVANHFKQFMPVTTNDAMYFSYVLARGTTNLNMPPDFSRLNDRINQKEVLDYLNNIPLSQLTAGFIADNYTLHGSERNYLSAENGLRVDTVRTTIEDWYQKQLISEDAYYYLLASLLDAISRVSNISGSFNSFLYNPDPRTLRTLQLQHPIILDNHATNTAYHRDANELVSEVKATVCYIDPPYAKQQYTASYHLLETVSLYDKPKIKGKTGIREYDDSDKSKYSSTVFAYEALSELIRDCQSPHVLISYTSRGIINPASIKRILLRYCDPKSIAVRKFNYHTYKGAATKSSEKHYEYLYYARKVTVDATDTYSAAVRPLPTYRQHTSPALPVSAIINHPEDQLKLLDEIVPLLPNDINEFVDVFSGGMSVALNVNAGKVYVNDIKKPLVEMFEFIATSNLDELLYAMAERIKKYALSRVNKKGYLKLRDYYNKNPNPMDLYLLIAHAYQTHYRFNSKQVFNAHFGHARAFFSDRDRINLIHYHRTVNHKPFVFSSMHFKALLYNTLVSSKALYYCHPPSLLLSQPTLESDRGFPVWKELDQNTLYAELDHLNDRGARFLLIGLTHHQDAQDALLIDWSSKYSQTPLKGTDGHSTMVAVYNY